MPLRNAAWYEPVRSNTLPDIQPPSAMPNSVHISTVPTRAPGLGRREVLADDDRVGRHDAALEQAEQGRDRRTARPANRRAGTAAAPGPAAAEPRSSVRRPPMRSQIAARDEPADDAAGEHQRQHLRAARGAVAEVAAVGDDVHLRHRHRDAAGDAGDAEQRLRRVHATGRTAAVDGDRRAGPGDARDRHRRRRPGAHQEREQRHRHAAEDAHADVGLAPADALDEVLDDRRPDRAGDVVAAGADRDRDAAPALEPERGVGDQRREGRRAADQAEQHAVRRARRSRCCPSSPATTKPRPRPTAPIRSGTATPSRSARRPIKTPPTPKPTISSVYGSEASARATPNSACTARQDDGDDVHRAAADRHQHQRDGETRPRRSASRRRAWSSRHCAHAAQTGRPRAC